VACTSETRCIQLSKAGVDDRIHPRCQPPFVPRPSRWPRALA
jgi:hypothetical protein